MTDLNLQMFGGRGGGSGKKSEGDKSTFKAGDEVFSARGIKAGEEYAVFPSKGKGSIRKGETLLSMIEKKSLYYDEELRHWVGANGSYIIQRVTRRKK